MIDSGLKTCTLLLAMLCSFAGAAEEFSEIRVGNFSHGNLRGWEEKKFNGSSQYRIIELEGRKVLMAHSQGGASGLIKKQRIDLQETPYLNWQWRIANRLGPLPEQQKAGDDYAARVYVIVSGGWAFWRTRAINYVWSGRMHKGDVWQNAFAGRHAMMIAVRSARDPVASWEKEKRNVRKDLSSIYGEDFRYIDAVALMTDTDNAGGRATAYYGDIYFSAE